MLGSTGLGVSPGKVGRATVRSSMQQVTIEVSSQDQNVSENQSMQKLVQLLPKLCSGNCSGSGGGSGVLVTPNKIDATFIHLRLQM
jgi:hypothetical protein